MADVLNREAVVVFPHQLFSRNPAFSRERAVYLVEDQIFFSDHRYPMNFHAKKLAYHRATMKAYEGELADRGYRVYYIEGRRDPDMAYLFDRLREDGIGGLHLADPVDDILSRRVRGGCRQRGIRLTVHPSPAFLTPEDWLLSFPWQGDRLSQTSFYIAQRRRLGILVRDGKPEGGRWSFDTSNRQRLPKELPVPAPWRPPVRKEVAEACRYVGRRFPDRPGKPDGLTYPVTRRHALRCLDDFLEKRIDRFGDYQDAMSTQHPFLFHALISPALNVGLLSPDQVVRRTLERHRERPVPLNCLEGFLRQIVGWREFVRAAYLRIGARQRTSNFWGFSRPMPAAFYRARSGIGPVDHVVDKVLDRAYAHHIERLMVLGNFFLLCEIDPDSIYYWFMDMFIDAYDWVMVPNVYGMSQYADGGLMTTKPYLSSSAYVRRMSDFPEGPWCRIWDGLYWRFLHRHRKTLSGVPRMGLVLGHLDRMDDRTLGQHCREADRFLEGL